MTATAKKTKGIITMTADDYAFGETCGYHLAECGIPADKCDVAAATCRLDIMGWHKGMHNGDAPRQKERNRFSGRWVHIQLATYGKKPHGPACHNWRGGRTHRARFVYADNFAAADYVLGCYGLTTDQVIDWITEGNGIGDDDRVTITLREIVEGMRPDLFGVDAMIASSNRNRNN